MKQLKQRADRIAGGVPIYEVYVGKGEGEVPVGKLRNHIMRMPRNFGKDDVYAIARKVEALDSTPGQMSGVPKGPIPRQAQNISGMNRRMRRAADRKSK